MEQAGICVGVWLWIHYFKKPVNMFEHMEIEEYIYEGVVELLYKNY